MTTVRVTPISPHENPKVAEPLITEDRVWSKAVNCDAWWCHNDVSHMVRLQNKTKQNKTKNQQKHKKINGQEKRQTRRTLMPIWHPTAPTAHAQCHIGTRVCIFTGIMISHGTTHRRHRRYRHVQLKIPGEIRYFSHKLNSHETTATQFCCNSVSCVMGKTSSRYWLDGDGDVTFLFNSHMMARWHLIGTLTKKRSAPLEPWRPRVWATYM